MYKKLVKLTALVLSLVICLSLTACGNSAQEDNKGSDNEGDSGLKLAIALGGPKNDGSFHQSGYEAFCEVCEEYGVEPICSENVSLNDVEATFTNYAAEGFDLVVANSTTFEDAAIKVGEKYPDTKFIVIGGQNGSDYIASYDYVLQEPAYVEGVLAALLTKTGIVGAVGGSDDPSIVRVVEAFKLGAKSVNPDIKTIDAYVGNWEDVAKAKELTTGMLEEGADIIGGFASGANVGVITACKETGALVFGEGDQNDLAQENVVVSYDTITSAAIRDALTKIEAGNFQTGLINCGLAYGAYKLVFNPVCADLISDDVMNQVNQTLSDIENGTIVVPEITTPTKN